MTRQPVAIARAIWCTIRLSGWLKAEIAATTPIGSSVVKAHRPAGRSQPHRDLPAREIAHLLGRIPHTVDGRFTSTPASTSGLPPS